jgi:hypothetical protein
LTESGPSGALWLVFWSTSCVVSVPPALQPHLGREVLFASGTG